MSQYDSTMSIDGGTVAIGYRTLHLDESVLARPKLRDHEGKKVVLGIRPEDFEGAALAVVRRRALRCAFSGDGAVGGGPTGSTRSGFGLSVVHDDFEAEHRAEGEEAFGREGVMRGGDHTCFANGLCETGRPDVLDREHQQGIADFELVGQCADLGVAQPELTATERGVRS